MCLREGWHERALCPCSSARLHLRTSSPTRRLLPCPRQAVLAARRNMAAVETEKPKSQVRTLDWGEPVGNSGNYP